MRNNIKIRGRSEVVSQKNQERAYSINHEYFDTIGANQAYIIGFIAADGSVSSSRNVIKIALQERDRAILEEIKKRLDFTGNIGSYKANAKFPVSELRFTSAPIKAKLSEFGIVENKTFSGTVSLRGIPDCFKKDWIRGFFDGDGSFSFNSKTKQGMVKITGHKSSEHIMTEILEVIPNGRLYNLPSRPNQVSLEYSTIPSIFFLNTIYKDAELFLQRKKENFENFLCLRNI